MTDDVEQQLDDLEARFEALNRARLHFSDRVDELQAENDRLRERVAELEKIVSPDPNAVEYEQLTRPQRVHRIRKKLVEQAARRHNGRSSMDYKEVTWLFDGHPSAGHAYTLMELAGDLDGFEYDPNSGKNHRVLVNLDGVNDESLFHAANKAAEGGSL